MKSKSPHILLASSNTRKMLENIRHLLDQKACDAIQDEIDKNVKALFDLGLGHFNFAKQTPSQYWRQRISRLYYGAYNVRRALQLHYNGDYNTDVSDHKKIYNMPDDLPNNEIYKRHLVDMREDRNIADYDHSASESDLTLTQDEAEKIVTDFIADVRTFLMNRGISL
jgi:hypothetical protein